MDLSHIDPHGQLCFVVGEPSGDRLGAELLDALRGSLPHCRVFGLVGPRLAERGVEVILPMEEIAVMGFTAVLRRLPTVLRAMDRMEKEILQRRPEGVILIDSPGFTLRLARKLRQHGYQGKIMLYVSPSVWAHGAKRVEAMARDLDMVLCLFPFEPHYYQHTSLDVRYVGCPLLDRVDQTEAGPSDSPELTAQVLESLPKGHPLIGLFPGSRRQDVHAHLPRMLDSARLLLLARPHLRFALSCSQEGMDELISTLIRSPEDPLQLGQTLFLVDQSSTLSLMRHCRAAIAKSGTITLELALLRVPTVVVYAVSWINALIIHYLLKVNLPFYSIANILGQYADDLRQGRIPSTKNQPVIQDTAGSFSSQWLRVAPFPELLARDFRTELVIQALLPLVDDGAMRTASLEGCDRIRELLKTETSPSSQAAAAVIECLSRHA
ncbi:MAG: lipid-A-disaccharide synthase [Chlamydiia bacterium]